MLIDTHLHLSNEDYDISKVLKRAKEHNVKLFITGGTNKENNLCDIKLSKKYKEVYITLGYHPEYAKDVTLEDLKLLEQQIIENKNKVVGIGEIGLDYHYGKENQKQQQDLFIKQIKLAKKYNLPVIIHSRDATEETYNILKSFKVTGVIHCFSGSLETANKYINLGFKLGIGGVITFSNSFLKEVVKQLDIKNILLETDSPYLSPIRGTKNEPCNIEVIAKFICNLKNISIKKLEQIMSKNVAEIFNIRITYKK